MLGRASLGGGILLKGGQFGGLEVGKSGVGFLCFNSLNKN